MKNKKKVIGNTVFFFALFGLTAYAVLKGKELSELAEVLKSVKPAYYIAGLVMIVVFVCCESYIIYRMLRLLHYNDVPKRNCVKYSFVGFFFSCITPSATGGQPMQLYYMNRDKVDISVGTVILMIVTILYKFVLVFLGALIFLFRHFLVAEYIGKAAFFFYLGMALNVFCVAFMLILVFEPTLASKIVLWLFQKLEKFHILKKKEECCSYYIVEAALLPEVGKELCDELWYIYTDEAVRRERLKSSRHYTDEKITRMIASQPVEEVFRKACTVSC